MTESSKHFDVGIIGGGLAGLASAILLAKGGHNVVLFEKNKYPFHRVCGEYVSLESWGFLNSLDLELDKLALPTINRLRVTTSKGGEINHNLSPGGFGISRYLFDDLLSNKAKESGATVLENTTVNELHFSDNKHMASTSKAKYTFDVAIGAFGKRSIIDKQLNRKFIQKPLPPARNFIAVKYHVWADLPDDLIELRIFKDGYCGISKVEGDKYCMCYLTTASNLQQYQGDIKAMEEGVLHQNPVLKQYFTSFSSLYEAPLVISQVNFSKKRAVEEHMLMAGDSAGLITPLCGNGMSMALHAASLAVPFVTQFLNSNISRSQMESSYSRVWNKQFSNRLFAGRTLQHMFFDERLIHGTLKLLNRFPMLTGKLVGLTHGKSF